MGTEKIRNFCIIAHVDHGKSTLADRFLELTHTVEARHMREQMLDTMDLERERGITIKLQPVRMLYQHSYRGNTRNETLYKYRGTSQNDTRNDAEKELLYEDLTYSIRGVVFKVRERLGLGQKEQVYHKAIAIELERQNIPFKSEAIVPVFYEGEKIGTYQPDFIIENKVILELKALPEIGRPQTEQIWSYLKGSEYKLALLVNFGSKDLEIKRIIFDTARDFQLYKYRGSTRNVMRNDAEFQQHSASSPRDSAQIQDYILNLIDTPGHVDFTYEVSRSLAAVEGAILLVDATQGVQAQTIANLYLALEQNLTVIPVINKIDLPAAQVDRCINEVVKLLGVKPTEILRLSGKTGQGVPELLAAVIERIPPPKPSASDKARALIFDSRFDDYRGVIAYVRMMEGTLAAGAPVRFVATAKNSHIIEVGTFTPDLKKSESLSAGEIGYIATGLKQVADCHVGDTVASSDAAEPLPGYRQVKPMVFAGFFCREGNEYPQLRAALEKLALSDAALQFEPENSPALGYGFRCGFLGLLHLEIVQERLRREYNQEVVVTVPSVAYQVVDLRGQASIIRSPQELPSQDRYRQVLEPMMRLDIVTPKTYLGNVMQMVSSRRGEYVNTEYLDEELAVLHYRIPLTQLLVDFYDQLKGVSSGYASLNYEFDSYHPCDVARLDILVADELEESLASLVYRDEAYDVGKRIVEKLKANIPKQQFVVKLQASLAGRIIAAERISALRKDVTAKLYGGDYTRKRKLLEKQKKGKKKMLHAGAGRVEVPPEAYLSVLRR